MSHSTDSVIHVIQIRSRWLRRLGIALAALLLFWGLAWLAAPLLLKNQAEKWGSQALGRTLTLGEVDFKPWSLELRISNLAIAGAAGDTHSKPQLHVDRMYVDADWSSLVQRAVVLNTIEITSPALRLDYKGDGRYDIDDILQRLKAAPENKEPDPKPLLFTLANMVLTGGSIDLTDRSTTTLRTHQLRDLQLALPLLSNFDALRDTAVTPRLAFVLNGHAVDTTAQATPFGSVRKGEATLKATRFDLAPYLPYLPSHLPIRIHSAVLDTELRVRFEQPHLGLSGKIKLSDLRLTDTAGADLAQLASVVADLSDVRPLERVVNLASLELNALTVHARRNPKGVLNLAFGSAQGKESKQSATKSDAPPAHSTGPTAQNGTWKLALKHFALHQGNLNWADDSVQPAARQSLTRLELQASNLHWPPSASTTSATSASLEGSGVLASRTRDARVQLRATGTPQAGQAHVSLSEIGLELATPYVAQYLQPGIAGLLDAELDANWIDNTLAFELQRLALRDFALTGPKIQMVERTSATATRDTRTDGTGAQVARLRSNDWPQWKLLEISNAKISPAQRAVHVGKITLLTPQVGVARGQDGRWMFQHWLKAAAQARPAEAEVKAESATPLPPWTASLDELVVQEGTIAFADRSMGKPVRLELSALALQAQNVSLDGKQPAPLQLTTRVRSGRTEPGTLRYQGSVMWAPMAVQGTLDLRDLPLHAVTPYVAEQLNIDLLRADASFKGDMRFALTPGGPEVQVKGDAALEDFRANSLLADTDGTHMNEELLSWKSLNMPGIAFTMAPGTTTRFAAREAALSDFYARVIVGKTGRINLQDLIKSPPPSSPAQTSAVATDSAQRSTAARITMGPISLVNGKVLFSDRFIQPNYSADLSALTGRLSQFSSAAPDGEPLLADLELHGRAEGSASLAITGKINPLARPLVLDIKGRVRDLELPPLSPYAVKYAGYGIERGKLGMDVSYTITPDGQLTANNNVMLNQLVFGDEVEGAANTLPVKLAAALLADSKGVIDIHLPISGSINDPEFSLGAVAWKAISNLLVKAVSAPFNLLASALGGIGAAEEAGVVHFAPGSNTLSQQAMQTLDKVAKALADRPALTLTIAGTASLEQERDALKRERLNALLLAEKRRRAVVSGQDAAAVTSFDETETSVLLKEVYKRADITKPRNVLGLIKEIAESDMETLLLTNIHLNAEALYELAQERSAVVKDYLLTQQLSEDRLFLGAAQVVQPKGDWTPSASLGLAHR
ncbi:MAG: DUF748 domain-containing protein [Rhodoferax sp.]|nr:DUF748 domain-containing protein [Rhodoferax sp.]